MMGPCRLNLSAELGSGDWRLAEPQEKRLIIPEATGVGGTGVHSSPAEVLQLWQQAYPQLSEAVF